MQQTQVDLLSSLKIVDESFRDLVWLEWKHRNLLYHDLWRSDLMRKNPYSNEEQAEGQLLYERNLHEADFMVSQATEKRQALRSSWDKIKNYSSGFADVCKFEMFLDCLYRFKEDFDVRIERMDKVLIEYEDHSKSFHSKILKSLKDSPAEHGLYSERFYEGLVYFSHAIFPEFQSLIREFKQSLEYEWPTGCCHQCIRNPSTAEKDAVLGQLQIKDKGNQTALSSRVMNQTDIVKAFTDSEKESG